MRSRSYPVLDRNAMSAGLSLSSDELTVTTNLNGLDFNRIVLGTLPKAVGNWFFGCYVWSESQAGLANAVSVGVAQPDVDMTHYLGFDTKGFGYRLGEGAAYTNNAQIAGTVGLVVPERLFIGIYLHLSAAPIQVSWYRQGTCIAIAALPTNKFWVPAFSLASGARAGDIKIQTLYGLDEFEKLPEQTIT